MKITLTRDFLLNGTRHKPGQTLDLKESTARFLLKEKAATEPIQPKPAEVAKK